jgi:hypothetical protein
MTLSKQTTSSVAGSSGGCNYEVLHSQAQKMVIQCTASSKSL